MYFCNMMLIIFGLFQVATALLFKVLGLSINDHVTPFSKGFITNLRIASGRYSTKAIFIRLYFIWHRPSLSMEYFLILCKKLELEDAKESYIKPSLLEPSHSILTFHSHHQKRMQLAREGKDIMEERPVIVLGNKIIDGHHRVDILKEIKNDTPIKVLYYKVKN